jgi:hypothetical protein
MPRPRPIDTRIAEAKDKLAMLEDKKRLEALRNRIAARRGKRRRRSM